MLEIKSYDSIRSRKEIKDNGNLVVFSAYKAAKRAGNELLDINDFINNKDIQDVIAVFLGHDIREFTISYAGTGLLEMLADFDKNAVKIAGMTKIKSGWDFETDEEETKPALMMKIA